MSHDYSGSVFTASFRSTGLTAGTPHDFFGLLAPSDSKVRIREISINAVSSDQTSIGVQLLRGSTASSTSAAISPVNLKGWSGAVAAGSSVTAPSSTVVSTASAVLLYAGFLDENSFCYCPEEIAAPILAESQRLHVRTDDAAVSMQGTITFEEIGKVPNA